MIAATPRRRVPVAQIVAGLFLVVGAVYTLSGPGRIDIIDGQLRYDVTRSLLTVGQPILRDPALLGMGITGRAGRSYAYYNAAPSVVAMPLVWMGGIEPDPRGETQRFLFSLTSGIFGALVAGLLCAFYLALGVAPGVAVWWSTVSAFATLLWPLSTSTFDQAQHAFFALLAVFVGWVAAQRGSVTLAAIGGLIAGILINYQESYALVLPTIAISTVGPTARPDRPARRSTRFLALLLGSCVGIALWLLFNEMRFQSPIVSGKSAILERVAVPSFGNPLIGLLGLLVSPGKGVLLYSPPTILAALGIRGLCRRDAYLGGAIVATTVVYVAFIASLSFFGGDWGWGPRYLVTILPLWALAFPFVPPTMVRRSIVGTVVVIGLIVQLLALSLDHQRFFFERALPDHFWARDRWFYFRESALLARPGELVASLREGLPKEVRFFAPGPYREAVTYAIFGNSRREEAPRWMRYFAVFYLPRPWPLWMASIPPERRPVRLGPAVLGTLAVGLVGIALVGRGLQRACVSLPSAADQITGRS
jgi:hypothetical protein